jgi:hypothetical protein
MASYTVTHKQLTDNYAVLQLLTEAEIEVGASVVITDVNATFNGTFIVYALPQYAFIGVDEEGDLLFDPLVTIPNQVLYAKTADDVARSAATGTLTLTQVAQWVTAANLEDWLGIGTATAADAAFLTVCAAAASQFCLASPNGSRIYRLSGHCPVSRCLPRYADVRWSLVPPTRISRSVRIVPKYGDDSSRRIERNGQAAPRN